MILGSPELDKFIVPLNWEFKKFDLKLINDLARNHPYQKIMFWAYEYYSSYDDEVEGDILDEIDYFKLLSRYYRYGITFEDEDLYPKKEYYMKKKILMTLNLELILKMVLFLLNYYMYMKNLLKKNHLDIY